MITGHDDPAPATRELTDAEIIARSLADPACFARIFDRHAAEIIRYLAARLGPEAAEDVAAETFLAAFRRRQTYDGSRPEARPWLYGIAVRQIGKHRRAEHRYRQAIGRMSAEPPAADLGDRSAERVTAQLLRPRLAATLAGLPERDRELLLLIAWADLSYEDTAAALGLTVGAVRSRLHRIRLRTREALGGTNPASTTDYLKAET